MTAGINLRVIGTSDLHTNIFPYDYYRDRPDPTVGLAATAALISAARGGGGQHAALRQRRRDPGNAARRLRRQRLGEGQSCGASDDRRHERIGLRRGNGRQSRIQLRPRTARQRRRLRELPHCKLQRAEARRRLLFQAVARSRALSAGRGRRRAEPEDRNHRICHAANRAVGPEPCVGPGDDDRHRRSRAKICACAAPTRRRRRHRALPFRHFAKAHESARETKTPRSRSRRSRASMR